MKRDNFRILPPKGIFIAKSSVHGFGVFASKNFKKDDVIEVSPFIRVVKNVEMLQYTNLRRYVFDDYHKKSCSLVGLGFTSVYNHSNDADAEFDFTDMFVVIQAIKNIKKGSEIFLDYGEGYDYEGFC